MALEWHRKMLGYALEGLGDYWCLDSFVANRCVTLLSLILQTLVVHIEKFLIAANSEAFIPLFYRTAQPCWETFCPTLWLALYNYREYLLSFFKK